jgi:hypothetical protein
VYAVTYSPDSEHAFVEEGVPKDITHSVYPVGSGPKVVEVVVTGILVVEVVVGAIVDVVVVGIGGIGGGKGCDLQQGKSTT